MHSSPVLFEVKNVHSITLLLFSHISSLFFFFLFFFPCFFLTAALRLGVTGLPLSFSELYFQVAVIAPNIPALYEAHFGVPMAGAVINAINIRLNALTISFLLGHSSSAVIMVDQEFFMLAEEALEILAKESKSNYNPPIVIVIADESCDPKVLQYALGKGAIEYEKFLESGDSEYSWKPPHDEWHSIALGYTSGTTASPKGVVLHHRGAYLMALSNAVIWGMNEGAIYLWTLPMFHCNGWCFTWTLAALCGTSICLRQVTSRHFPFMIGIYIS